MAGTNETMLPFSALVGLDAARRALLLLAVDPTLGGVVMAAGVGTGKSTLMRSYARLVAGIGTHNGAAPSEPPPFVELPVGVTEDRLLGGIDLEATLATGTRRHRSGLLARAHGGMLYADGVNLLEESTINHVLGALDTGTVRIEREGLSLVELASFALLATYDPAEGVPRRHLLDRVGLIVAPLAKANTQTRYEVVRRNLSSPHRKAKAARSGDNDAFLLDWEEEQQMLQAMLAAARELLPNVQMTDAQIEQLAGMALAFGVEGHRADIFAARVALASAALAGRETVEDADLEQAVRYVLLPRATRMPQFEQQQEQPQEEEPPEPPPPPDEPDQQTQQDDQRDEAQEDEEQKPPEVQMLEDMVLAALETDIPPDILETPFTIRRSGRSGSRGSTSGQRGRHVRSVPGTPGSGRLDVIATLRAAAPWQEVRRQDAANGAAVQRSILLRADDLHIKRYRSKAGTLFCFLVDASGSMALHRMRQAKGAVNTLLEQAYVHRDQVALLAFRGQSADVLLPPSQSVELASRALEVLPTGGGTPLAAALLSAYQIAEQARSRGIHQTTLVLITDGRPNVPLNFDQAMPREQRMTQAREEVQRLAARLQAAGVGAVVVDTQRQFLTRGEAQQLAAWLGGRYVYLPQGKGEEIAQAVLAERDEG
jgi:magnesium chelatase subunit D